MGGGAKIYSVQGRKVPKYGPVKDNPNAALSLLDDT